ncbi:peptidylprolyl isomerase [Amycolatopsis alba]|uniref:Peptidylprolyl isomerase n=1 Tax=Amycolatopsis alba DSM 44262 TaxID=1125972 RepID=A0A229RBR0_AMYAL|nr:peptidylprolyl isomerase [Amycolatopsis alba]OXM43901.1 peptidylprolyl isomerase [Amycolatopsis alba DSM 44262]
MPTNQQRREAAKRKLERQIVHRAEKAKRRKIVGSVAVVGVVAIVAGAVWWIVSSSSGDDAASDASPSSAPPTPEVTIPTERTPMPKRPTPLANPVTCDYKDDTTKPASKKVTKPEGGGVSSTGTVNLVLKSTAGDIPLTLDKALAPCAVQSFISLSKQGYFNDTKCHRLGTTGLQMLQCGDPEASGMGGPGYTMPDEAFKEIKYGRGILAMAKTQQPNSGGSQFFMVYGEAELPAEYSVFGSISDEGLKVLDKVAKAGANAQAGNGDGTGPPNTEVKFTGVTVSP